MTVSQFHAVVPDLKKKKLHVKKIRNILKYFLKVGEACVGVIFYQLYFMEN